MKLTKKLSAILLALVMVLSMTATAFAATVTLPNAAVLEGHNFTAYQVFAGREEGGVLSDVTEGSGVSFAAFLTALQANAEFGSKFTACKTAEDVAKVLSGTANDSALAETVAEIAYANKVGSGAALAAGENELADGYYLIVDTTKNLADGSAYNKALLQVVGERITIGLKTDAPSVEKKVYENTKYNNNADYGQGFNDVADYNMGDAVPFHLIGTVPNMTQYDTYLYIFHDSYSEGLNAPQNIKVYLSSDKALDAADVEVTASFEFDGNDANRKFSLTCADLKAVVGDSGAKYVIVDYTAVLNQNAVVGLPGNPNEVTLEYANNPNWTVDSWKDGKDNDGDGEIDEDDEKDDQPTGETPKDVVIVFTYELDTTKIDGATAEAGDPTKLAGAEFVLYRGSAAAPEYAKLDATFHVIGWTTVKTEATTLTSGADGLFKVIGLDDGTYYLEETKAPTGYNLLKNPITVVISATTSNGQNWGPDFVPSLALTDLAVTADGKPGTADENTGIAAITIANNKGATLPETGGMGTTVLYIVGSLLVLGAAVLLITKKRMENN